MVLDVNNGVLMLFCAVVGIVGGGIGGFALALAFQHVGIKVRVFERDSSVAARPQGMMIDFDPGC